MMKSDQETNFDEALKNAFLAYEPYTVHHDVRTILDDPKVSQPLVHDTPKFWILVHALKLFVDGEGKGKLPLKGSIPDMTAETKTYVELQNMYREKSEREIATIISTVRKSLESLSHPTDWITEDEVRLFCKNSLFLKLIRYRSLEQEYDSKTINREEIESQLSDTTSNVGWYLLFRSVYRFFKTHKRYPGQSLHDDLSKDRTELHSITESLLKELNLPPINKGSDSPLNEDLITEMVRFGNAQLHNICAILGGIGAQEIIKIITQQWLPMDHTLVYNGITSTSSVFTF